MKYFEILLFLFSIVFYACKNQVGDSKILTVDITGRYDEINLNLDECVNGLRIIRIETKDSSLIESFSGYIGEKYLINIAHDKVILFSSNGKYIKTIAKKGKGPREFTQIDAWTVDEKEESFLFHDITKNYIYNFNLISQQYQYNIPFEDHGFLNNILLINDTILSILPGRYAKYGYLFFNQTISGRIVGGIAKEDITHPGTWAGRNPLFRLSSDNSILFQPSESDTIFRITGAKMTPVYSFIFEKPQKNGYKTTGSNVLYLHSDDKQFLFSKIGFESEIAPDHSSFNFISNDQLSYNTKTKRISKISSVLMGSMGLQLENAYLIFSEKNRVFIPLQAAHFKKNLEKSIKKDGIILDNKEKLIKLNNEITDTDNPIIITGIWK